MVVGGVVAVAVAAGALTKLKFEIESGFKFGEYKTGFDFEWELKKQKEKRKEAEEQANQLTDSKDMADIHPQDQEQQQPVVNQPTFIPAEYPLHYW